MFSLGHSPSLSDFDPEIIEKDQIKQKGNSFLYSIASGVYTTLTSSKLFDNFFRLSIDTPLKFSSIFPDPVCLSPFFATSFLPIWLSTKFCP